MNFVLQQTSPHAATISDKRASPRATFDYAESDAALIESDAKRARRAEFAFSPAEGGNPAQSPFLSPAAPPLLMNPVPTVPPSAPVDPGQAVREAQELLQAELQKVRAERNDLARQRAEMMQERAALREARAALEREQCAVRDLRQGLMHQLAAANRSNATAAASDPSQRPSAGSTMDI